MSPSGYDIPRLHPDLGDYVGRWDTAGAAFRREAGGDLDVGYGSSDRQRIDFFTPDETPDAMVLFFHGGYWVEGDRKLYSHLAAGPLAQLLAVGVVGYDLAPAVELGAIVAQAKAAVAFAVDRTSLPIVVAGHSAGGHLAAMAIADDAVATNHAVVVSGLFDLEPFLDLPLNKLLGLDAGAARRLSPIRLDPPAGVSVRLAVGEAESDAFHGQSRQLVQRWSASGADAQYVAVPGRHHLSVIEDLADPEGVLVGLCRDAAEQAAS